MMMSNSRRVSGRMSEGSSVARAIADELRWSSSAAGLGRRGDEACNSGGVLF